MRIGGLLLAMEIDTRWRRRHGLPDLRLSFFLNSFDWPAPQLRFRPPNERIILNG
jgi:hypothetical protein